MGESSIYSGEACDERKSIADGDEVLEYLTSVIRREVDVGERERLRAAELLGKRHGVFTDKLQVGSPVTIVIADDYGD